MPAVYKYDTIDSTNKEAIRLIRQGAADGTVVMAYEQTAGRGRSGRTWVSTAGDGLYFTIILQPKLPRERVSMLTPVMACSIARALADTVPEIGIKWPNDLIVRGRKLCGILTEFVDGDPYHIVIGVGLNLNHEIMPTEQAISLKEITGERYQPEEVLHRLLTAWNGDYELVSRTGTLTPVKDGYEAFLVNLGRQVKVLDPKGEYEGIAQGVDEFGRLLVDGRIVDAGEVSVRGIYGYI